MKFKNAVLTAFTIMFAASAQVAFADLPRVYTFRSELTRWELDPSLERISPAQAAYIELDVYERTATLNIQFRSNCPEGAKCLLMMPIAKTVKLPIVSVKNDNCGGKTYVAERAIVPVGGKLEKLVIRDNTGFHCPILRAQADVEVLYTTSQVAKNQPLRTRSKLEGTRFEAVK